MFPSPFDDSLTFTNNPPSSPNSDHHRHHQNPPPPFLFNLPSPFFDEDTLPLNQIFFQTTHLMTPTNHHPNNDDPPTKDQPAKSSSNGPDLDQPVPGIVRRRSLGVVPRRRTGKKDRHSKICTAQGIRDRRMRLSLQVARKFFDLQDMLGYDKASKTIEWLFTKSKKAIKELCKGCSPNKGSDAKTENFLNNDEKMGPDPQGCVAATPLAVSDPNSDTKDDQKPNKTTAARQSRDKARERARSRAKEKRIVKQYEESSGFNKSNPNLQKLGFSNIQFEDHQSNKAVSPYSPTVFTSQEFSDLGTIEKFLGNSSSSMSSSCPISDYLCSGTASGYIHPNCNNLMGFSGNNWDLLNNDRMNSIQDVFTNQVQLADNPNSTYLATANFP